MAAGQSYPDELLYHPEHDWARIDEARERPCSGSPGSRSTRSASSCTSSRPRSGSSLAKDDSYGEVESVKAVSDADRAALGEVLEVNAAVVDEPATVNDDPYGGGWLVKVADVGPVRARLAARRRRLPRGLGADGRPSTLVRKLDRYTLTAADRDAMLAAIGVDSLEELFADIPPGVRLRGELDVPPGLPEEEVFAHLRELAGRTRRRRGLASSAPASTTTTCRRVVDAVLARASS